MNKYDEYRQKLKDFETRLRAEQQQESDRRDTALQAEQQAIESVRQAEQQFYVVRTEQEIARINAELDARNRAEVAQLKFKDASKLSAQDRVILGRSAS